MKTKTLILGLISLLMLSCTLTAKVEKRQINISWKELFPDHLERVYIFMKDGTIFRHSSQYESMIAMNIDMLEKELKEKNLNIKQIGVIVHNHRISKNFSRSDYRQYWTLKGYGFKGQFLMYCHRTKEIYDIEDKNR